MAEESARVRPRRTAGEKTIDQRARQQWERPTVEPATSESRRESFRADAPSPLTEILAKHEESLETDPPAQDDPFCF